MNVLYVLSSSLPSGGATKAFLQMMLEVKKKGVLPFVLLPDKDGIYTDLVRIGVNVMSLTYRPNTYPRYQGIKNKMLFLPRMIARLVVNYSAIHKLKKWCNHHSIDLIHTNVGIIHVGYETARRLKIPHIYHIREYGDLDFGYHYFPNKQFFLQQLNAPNSFNICITKDIQSYFNQTTHDNSRVIYDGVCPKQIELPCYKKEPFFLYAGRIDEAKDVLFLIKAYHSFLEKADMSYRLLLAGDILSPAYYREIKQNINLWSMESQIEFLGRVDNLPLLMRQATAIIIPSHKEGFGLCMPEAMFNGCLAMGRNTGGTKEQFDNGLALCQEEIGLRFDTIEELAELMVLVSKRTADYSRYVQRAFYTVNSLYTVEENANRVYSFYKKIFYDTDN